MKPSTRSDVADGLTIHQLRRERGMTVDELAEASGLTRRTLQRVLAGHPADISTIKSIAAVLEVEYADIRRNCEQTPPAPGVPRYTILFTMEKMFSDFVPERDWEEIVDTIRGLTRDHFEAEPKKGKAGRLIVKVEMAEGDAFGEGSIGWVAWIDGLIGVDFGGASQIHNVSDGFLDHPVD